MDKSDSSTPPRPGRRVTTGHGLGYPTAVEYETRRTAGGKRAYTRVHRRWPDAVADADRATEQGRDATVSKVVRLVVRESGVWA